jgi:glucokinase
MKRRNADGGVTSLEHCGKTGITEDEGVMDKAIVGVDLGGTKVSAGRVQGGRLVQRAAAPIDSRASQETILGEIIRSIERLFTSDVAGIGVGVPSVVDVEKGIVYDVQNIPSWKEVPLRQTLEDRFKRPVYVNNDANCFAAGEKYFGKGRPYRNLAGVTVGTGLGTGLVIEGRLYSGANCGAGEFGMIPYEDSVLERYASGQYFERRYGVRGDEIFARAQKGDLEALEIFRRFGGHLGDALMMIMLAVDPEAIILGGSVSKASAFFGDAMRRSLKSFPYHKSAERIVIEISEEPEIAVLGAAALYLDARRT